MQHLKWIRDSLVYHTAETGKCIQISVDYDIGGMSYFSGQPHARGIWVRIRPIEISDGFMKFGLFNGVQFLAEATKRKNDKKLLAIAEKIDGAVQEAAILYDNGRTKETVECLKNALAILAAA